MGTSINVPKSLYEEAVKKGIDLEDLIVMVLAKILQLDPNTIAKAHLELAEKFLGEGRDLASKDPIQASEKLYKAAEEVVKALAIHFKLEEILRKVEGRGRWRVEELEEAVEAISERIGSWFRSSWDAAWILHIWGFHEAKLGVRAIELRLPDIERMFREAKKIMEQGVSP